MVGRGLQADAYFNPRSREGSDLEEDSEGNVTRISIHAPAKGATGANDAALGNVKFQSTLPRRERRQCRALIAGIPAFQSTLPRRERRKVFAYSIHSMKISIHAPVKGATRRAKSWRGAEHISIHAPVKGATTTRRTLFT